ncbi:MAG: FKBP-type peptidyl-prolyl cis-trans isomerase [Bacteroides sp.]|nr:FKBP-type peptidyl-prolyl cis-trans isomerase [Bacteroides sp.]
MKKFTFMAVMAIVAGLASCTAQGPKGKMNTEIDSLSYAFALAQSQGIEQFFMQQGIDSTMMIEFLKGYNDGVNKSEKSDKAYIAGLQIGQMVGVQWVERLSEDLFGANAEEKVNRALMIEGFKDGITKSKNAAMTMNNAQAYMNTHMQSVKENTLLKKYADNKAAGEKFLAENKEKEGVVTLPSGLQYKVITEGKGAIPTKNDKVKVHYKGTLIDGTEFDSSYKRKDKDGNSKPAEFRASQVIKGWTEALTLMPVGSKWELYIPQELAYGSRETGGEIKPFSALIFEVELVEIVPTAKKK